MHKTRLISALVGCIAVSSWAAEMLAVVGQARVVDATVLLIDDHRIQLDGVYGPLSNDVCFVDAAEWSCGLEAKQALAERLAEKAVACDGLRRLDDGALLAQCKVGDEDVAQWLVDNGWALGAPAGAYVGAETTARSAGLGVWRGGYVPPDFWRVRDSGLGCNACAARKARLKKKQTAE